MCRASRTSPSISRIYFISRCLSPSGLSTRAVCAVFAPGRIAVSSPSGFFSVPMRQCGVPWTFRRFGRSTIGERKISAVFLGFYFLFRKVRVKYSAFMCRSSFVSAYSVSHSYVGSISSSFVQHFYLLISE